LTIRGSNAGRDKKFYCGPNVWNDYRRHPNFNARGSFAEER